MLFRSLVSRAESDHLVKYRNQFEDFLNKYNISHISFNFLPNLIFEKTGNALDIGNEVLVFRERIKNISTIISEKKQAKTNFLLQLVTGLSGLSIIPELPGLRDQILQFTHWTQEAFYVYVGVLLIIGGLLLFYYFNPEKVKKWFRRK